MKDVMSEHADRVTTANAKLLADLEAAGEFARGELATKLSTAAQTVHAAMETIEAVYEKVQADLRALIEETTHAAADALTANLMAVAASETALRCELGQRLSFFDTGRLPDAEPREGADEAPVEAEPSHDDEAETTRAAA